MSVIDPKESTAPKKKVRKIGELDLAILNEIAKKRLVSLSEIQDKFFPGHPRKRVWEKMKKLRLAGLVQESRGDQGVLLGWFIPGRGERMKTYRTNYDHDRVVQKVLTILEKATCFVLHESAGEIKRRVLRTAWRLNVREKEERALQIPDAVFEIENQGTRFRCALEVELTRKSKQRLLKKFDALASSNQFNQVFFLAQGVDLLNLTRTAERDASQRGYARYKKIKPNEIWFCELSEFLKNGIQAQWVSRRTMLSLSQLSSPKTKDAVPKKSESSEQAAQSSEGAKM
jgi:hypothetical protein